MTRDLWLTRLRRLRPSRIGRRLLAFNLLLVFLPVAGILYLDVYETRLLDVQERGMVQQGRLVAAALGDRDRILPDEAEAMLSRLGRRGDARIRVYDAAGVLLADSVRAPDLGVPEQPSDAASSGYAKASGVRERLLYRLGAWLVGVRRAMGSLARSMLARSRATSSDVPPDPTPGPELRAALEGRYGADVRPTPGQRSLTLYSAVPIRHGDRVVGVALVSQSTFRILQALYEVRLRIFEIVIASFAAAVAIGLLMSATLVRPLVRLRHAALALSDRRATPGRFRPRRSPGRDRGPGKDARRAHGTARCPHQAPRIVCGRRSPRVQEPAGLDSRCRGGHRLDRGSRRTAASSRDAHARRRPTGAVGLRGSGAGASRRTARARGGGHGRRVGPA